MRLAKRTQCAGLVERTTGDRNGDVDMAAGVDRDQKLISPATTLCFTSCVPNMLPGLSVGPETAVVVAVEK